jgi:hypothetical protein
MWQALGRCGRWRGELWNRRKDGQTFLESLTISAVHDPDGQLTHYVGVFSDITELRQAHDQLDHQAHHDPLTGLPNRLLLGDRLHKALQRAHRDETDWRSCSSTSIASRTSTILSATRSAIASSVRWRGA